MADDNRIMDRLSEQIRAALAAADNDMLPASERAALAMEIGGRPPHLPRLVSHLAAAFMASVLQTQLHGACG